MLVLASPVVIATGFIVASTPLNELGSPLTLALAVCAVIGTFVSVDLEGTLFWDGSFIPVACAVALLDPAPVAAIALLSEVAVLLRERYRPPVFVLNLVGVAPNVAAAWVMSSLATNTSALEYYAVFGLVIALAILLNLVAVTTLVGIYYDQPIWSRLLGHWRLAPAVAINVVLAFAAVGAYRSEGIGATVLVIAGVFVFAYVANRLATEREQRIRIEELAASRGWLVAQLLETEDRERRALAHVLHDDVVQTLLVARQDLREAEADHSALRPVVARLDEAVRQVREAIFATHPSVLDRVGLSSALRTIAEHAATRGRFRIDVRVEDEAVGLYDRLIFSSARELLANAVKHSSASTVHVDLSCRQPGVVLTVSDDGMGFDLASVQASAQAGHIGLQSIVERVEAVEGSMRVIPTSPSGVEVSIALPVPKCVPPKRLADEAANRDANRVSLSSVSQD